MESSTRTRPPAKPQKPKNAVAIMRKIRYSRMPSPNSRLESVREASMVTAA